MSRSMPTYMGDRTLVPEFSLGPLRFTNADSFPLEEVFCHIEEHEITLRLSGGFEGDSPWRGRSMVVFFLFRLSVGAEAFDEETERYRKDEVEAVELPEGRVFDETVLALPGMGGEWEHDCFAAGSRNLFHVYRSANVGVMIRWFSQTGTMLDHPLLSVVRDNVKLVADQWETDRPETLVVQDAEEAEDDDGDEEELELVLKLDLREDQQKVRQFIEERIANYSSRDNYGPGEPGDAVRLITLGYYAEQTGYVALVFDTRAEADSDGQYTLYLDEDNVLYLPEWYGLYMAVCQEETVTLIGHDGNEHVITDNQISDEDLNTIFGEMLVAVMQELRDNGGWAKLPLHPEAFMNIEEFDGRYGWPDYDDRKPQGAVSK